MTLNDIHLIHSVSILMAELHAFAGATGAPAGANVFRWAEAKADEASLLQKPNGKDRATGEGAA